MRIALHAGPVVAGECGDAKLAIVSIGDTMNTVARIERLAKTLERDSLISGALLARLDPPPSLQIEALGPMHLRGRRQPITLHALRPAASPVASAAE